MKKDAYYFPHDSNATNDPKIMILMAQLGLEGYGIYWTIIEHLRDQPGFRSHLAILEALALRYGTSKEKYKAVVTTFGLFEIDTSDFFSPSLVDRMMPLLEKRKKLSEAGIRGNLKRWGGDRVAIGTQSQVKESIVDKSIVKKSKVDNINNKSFEIFWNMYNKKVDKKACQVSWNNLTKKDQEAIINNIPSYIENNPEVQFRKDPKSYIYNRSWENEYLSEADQEVIRLKKFRQTLVDNEKH